MRVLQPYPHVLAFYDGRVPGYRFAEGFNWVDDGALSLGIASYAVVDGKSALVYDTHTTLAHARAVRRELEDRGVRDITVVLSHWHLDHVAGNEVFADRPIWASARTASHLAKNKAEIEAGTREGPPVISPLILPTHTFEGSAVLRVGRRDVKLLEFDIHSDDATVLWLEGDRLLFAGDTLEDTVTYVVEPHALATHRRELDRMKQLAPAKILPNHGDPDVIACGGYDPSFISATQSYIDKLLAIKAGLVAAETPLRALLAPELRSGALRYFAAYEPVHARNVELICRRSESV
jgi:glyoxylase-like metal-dependent hydrolase (beta-lactamase superfamily II)